MAIISGFIPLSLGDRILSAVTAPVVALAIIAAFLDQASSIKLANDFEA